MTYHGGETPALLADLALLVAVARLLGELARRRGVPAVLGELAAGLVLGPTCLGALAPDASRYADGIPLTPGLEAITTIGLVWLLFTTGLDTDLRLVRRAGRAAAAVALGGLLVPLVAGVLVGLVAPARFLGAHADRGLFAALLATALAVSALPVIARVLADLELTRRDVGQVVLAAAMFDDVVGWFLLSLVAGLARDGTAGGWGLLEPAVSLVAVGAGAVLVGRRVVAWLCRFVDDRAGGTRGLVSLAPVLALAGASLTAALGLEAVLGSFVVGMLLREAPRFRPDVSAPLEVVTASVLAPAFFASAGLRVDLGTLASAELAGWSLALLVVATLSKLCGVRLGARAAGLDGPAAAVASWALNARGAMQVVVASVGLSSGLLGAEGFSVIVLIAVATSLMAPAGMRSAARVLTLSEGERARLEQDERMRSSFWAGLRHVLLATRGGSNVRLAARLLRDALVDGSADVTVVTLHRRGRTGRADRSLEAGEAALRASAATLAPLPVRTRRVESRGSGPEVLVRAAEPFDLLVLGASREPGDRRSDRVFGSFVDRVVRGARGAVLVLHAPRGHIVSLDEDATAPPRLAKILVPSSGAARGRPAQELGLALARANGGSCTVLEVREPDPDGGALGLGGAPSSSPVHATAPLERRVVHDRRVGATIAGIAARDGFDLIVLHAERRPETGRTYLGPQVDAVLRAAVCPVAVLISR